MRRAQPEDDFVECVERDLHTRDLAGIAYEVVIHNARHVVVDHGPGWIKTRRGDCPGPMCPETIHRVAQLRSLQIVEL
jgi:hypothetical protein